MPVDPKLGHIDIPRAGEGKSVHVGALGPLPAIFCQRIEMKAGVYDASAITDGLVPCYIDGRLAALVFYDKEGMMNPVGNAYDGLDLVAGGSTREGVFVPLDAKCKVWLGICEAELIFRLLYHFSRQEPFPELYISETDHFIILETLAYEQDLAHGIALLCCNSPLGLDDRINESINVGSLIGGCVLLHVPQNLLE